MMKMKSFAKILFISLLSWPAMICAQVNNPRQTLDVAARKITSGGIQASFEAEGFTGTKSKGATTGTIYIKGGKFKLESDQMSSWFDGKTLWSYLHSSNEVNVSTPSAAEIQSMNPYYFITLYRSGYALSQTSTSFRGKSAYEVRMLAQNRNAQIKEALISVDRSTNLPLCIRFRQGTNSWTRISLSNLKTNKKWGNSFFKFNNNDYPKLEVVDLR